MKKWSNRGKRPEIQLPNNSNFKISSNVSPQNKSFQIQNHKNSPQHKTSNQTNSQNEKIIHHSIYRNYDKKGNSIVRTKIVKEIDLENNEEMDNRQNSEFIQYGMNNRQQNDYINYSNEGEENPQIIYDENYEIISPRSYNTKFKGTQQFRKIEISDREIGGRDGRISPRGRGIVNLKTGKISPVMLFNTPESEYDGHRSYYLGRNYQEFMNNNNNNSNISINRHMETTQRGYKNYNLESPYNISNHSPIHDFGSPDGYNDSYFRNIPIENIKEKKPYQNKKINIRNIQNESSLEYDKNLSSMQEKLISIPDGEDELYDMVDCMATLIQSHIRGFLVRKKVLRFITIAIYHQSFCDKIQDVLSSHVKTEIFEKLKSISKEQKNNINNMNKINKNTPKKTIRKEYSETYLTNKNINIKKLKKDNSNLYNSSTDFNRSYNKYNRINNLEKSQSPSSRVFHYYIHSPCTKMSPHHRYYHEISSKTTNVKNYGTETNQLNKMRLCNRCDDIGKIKRQDKFYITTTREVNKEEIEEQEEYRKRYEINKEYIVEENKEMENEEKQDINIEEKIEENKNIKPENEKYFEQNNKYSQLSYNNSFTMRKCIEKDNYLSINIIKLPGNEKMSKNLSSRDIFSKTTKSPNRISKVESINIKTTKRQKTEQEIEEEINRRVKITIIEREKAERERKKKEEEKKIIQKRMEIEKEKERKQKEEFIKTEKERKEKEELIKKEKERKEKEELIKKEKERMEKEEFLKKEKERKEKEELIKKERERKEKEKEEFIKKERERKEKERKEKERKEKEEFIKKEKERKEKERKEKEEFNRKERERMEKERKEKLEKERKEKEEILKKEREQREQERKEKYEKEIKEREEKIKKIREKRFYNNELEDRKAKLERLRIEQEKHRKLVGDESKKFNEKNTNTSELNQSQFEQTTTTKTINTKKVTYIKSNIDNTSPNTNININKRQTSTNSNSGTNTNTNKIISTNIKTIKLEEEKKINMSDYILKKDCQKNLEMMKSKLEKEYQKKIEYEKNKSIQEQKRYEQIIEIKNKKEIERIIQEQKKKELEIKKMYEKEKENNKKKEIEIQKQREKEMQLSIQREIEKQKELLLKKELEEKNKKLKLIKINKVFEYNLKSQPQPQSKLLDKNISSQKIEIDKNKNKEKAMKLIKKIILFRGNYLLKLRKYFNDWRLKTKLIELSENADAIKKYCREMLERSRIKRAKSNWYKLSQKIFNRSRLKILKMFPKLNSRKKKIYELIRITKLTRIFSLRRYLHYIILIWYIYTQNIHRKRVNMKFLYENLLKTYMSLAQDIFGNNQIENPSVQDAMYEAVNTNKFISLFQDDVPLARQHYEEMRKKRLFKNRREYSYNNYNSYKFETEKKEIKTTFYSREKVNKEENNNLNYDMNNSIDGKRNEEILNKYKQYKSMNRDLIMNKKNRFIASIEKDNNNEDNIDEKKFENKKIYTINKINFNNTNFEDNKSPKGNKYIYQKTEVNNTYTKPLGNKYDIKIKEIKDNKDIINNKRIYNQENNKQLKSSYSYRKINQENKLSSNISTTKFQNKENIGNKNNLSGNKININISNYQSKYLSSEGNNKSKDNEKRNNNKIDIKTSSSYGKDKNKFTYSNSIKK